MAVLDQVTQLRSQGMNDDQIAENLQQQGVSPKEITDAINQANIKNAVSGENPNQNPPANPGNAGNEAVGGGGYTPSTQEMSAPAPTDNYAEQGYGGQQGYDQGGAGYDQGAYAQGGYGQGYSGGYGAGASDSGSIIEIANQVFEDKSKKMQDQLDELTEFKTMTQSKVDSIDERLKKIEKMIDTIQIKILEKVGSYGRELDATKKEVKMVEDSVGKLSKNMASKKSKSSGSGSSSSSKSKSRKKKSKKSKKSKKK